MGRRGKRDEGRGGRTLQDGTELLLELMAGVAPGGQRVAGHPWSLLERGGTQRHRIVREKASG